jgi:YD repeat-containing protein
MRPARVVATAHDKDDGRDGVRQAWHALDRLTAQRRQNEQRGRDRGAQLTRWHRDDHAAGRVGCDTSKHSQGWDFSQ